jgi:hypothetical protein
LLRIKLAATEPLQEFICVRGILKTINLEPFPIVEQSMTSRVKRQILAELVNLFVAATFTTPRRQNYLVRQPRSIAAGDSSPFRHIPKPPLECRDIR